MITTIASHEFKSHFKSPMAWTLLAVLQIIIAYIFLTQVETFILMQAKLENIQGAPGLTDIIITPLFSNAGIILLLVTPLLTMRVICEERRNKTLNLLLSAPISNTEIILGKFIGTLGLLWVMVLLIALIPLALLLGGDLDLGKYFANVLGLGLLVAAFTATGVFMSTIVNHPTVAAMGTFGSLLILWLFNISKTISDQPNQLIEYLSLLNHFQNIQSGLIDTNDLGYFVVFISLFIVLSIRYLSDQQLRLKKTLLTIIMVTVLANMAWLSNIYTYQIDATYNASNTLSANTQKLLDALPDPVTITAYIEKGQSIRSQIAQLVDRYQHQKSNITLRFIDPKDKDLKISPDSIVTVEYQGRHEKLAYVDEAMLSQALFKLGNNQANKIDIPIKDAQDKFLQLSETQITLLNYLYLLGLPLILLLTGIIIWQKRKAK